MKSDPLYALAKLVYDNWNGNADLDSDIDTIEWGTQASAAKEVRIIHSEFDEEETSKPQIAFERGDEDTTSVIGGLYEDTVIRVVCGVPRDYNDNDPGDLMKWLFQMSEEVKRIIRATVKTSGHYPTDKIPSFAETDLRPDWLTVELYARLEYIA